VEFDYDPAKSRSNAQKHGMDFEAAKALWQDPKGGEIDLTFPDEPRYARIAKRSEAHREVWTAIFTLREGKLRLISVRRARAKERTTYG
jgi:uncharacterized DUF497 family protein